MSENGVEEPRYIRDTLEEVVAQETQEEYQALLGQLNLAISLLRQEQIELVRLHIFEGKSLAKKIFKNLLTLPNLCATMCLQER